MNPLWSGTKTDSRRDRQARINLPDPLVEEEIRREVRFLVSGSKNRSFRDTRNRLVVESQPLSVRTPGQADVVTCFGASSVKYHRGKLVLGIGLVVRRPVGVQVQVGSDGDGVRVLVA